MNERDEQALAAIRDMFERDARVREDIQNMIECYDRAFVALMVTRLVEQLHLEVSDMGAFTACAYEWLKREGKL